MTSLNKATIIGRLGQDPQIRSTGDGREIASFSLATSESWKDKSTGEKKEKTEWHNIIIFNPILINLVKNWVKKGTLLYIEGKLQTRKWDDKKSGTEKPITEIVLNDFSSVIQILSSKQEPVQHYSEPPTPRTAVKEFYDYEEEDDIPF